MKRERAKYMDSRMDSDIISKGLKAILENSDDYIFFKDKALTCQAASNSFCKMMGCSSADELIGKEDYELFERELADKYRMDDLEVINKGTEINGTCERIPDADGKLRWTQTWKFPIRDDNGEIIGLCGMGRNVTREIELETKAKNASEYLKLINNIPGGIAIIHYRDGVMYIDYANDGYYKIRHIAKGNGEKIMDLNAMDSIYEPDRDMIRNKFELLEKKLISEASVTYRVRGDDGCLHWISAQLKPGYFQNGVQYYYASGIDVDKEKHDELEIVKTQSMYSAAARLGHLLVWEYDIETHTATLLMNDYSREICERFGMTERVENVPYSYLGFVDERDKQSVLDMCKAVDEGAASAESEYRFKMPGHAVQQYERMTLQRINDSNGNLLTVLCCGQNITLLKQEEDNYKSIFSQLYNQDAYGTFHLNLTKNICENGEIGRGHVEIMELLQKSKTADDFCTGFAGIINDRSIREDYCDRFRRELLIERFNNGIKQESIEYTVICPDGKRKWLRGILNMARNPCTGDIEAIAYSLDIDDRKRNEQIMNNLINEHFDYLGIIHPVDGTFEFVSKKQWIKYGAMANRLDYNECLRHICGLFHDKEAGRKFGNIASLENVLHDLAAEPRRNVSYTYMADGEVKCIRLQYTWLDEPGGDIFVVRSDITDTYVKELSQAKQLREALAQADLANKAKSDFLSNMSHDMRTPLNGIIGFTEYALKETDPERKREYLGKVRASGQLLLNLINDTLDLSRIESGKETVDLQPVSEAELIGSVITSLEPSSELKGITIDADYGVDQSLIFLTDKIKAQKIVLNLVSNAIKYTNTGGMIRIRTELTGSAEAGYVRIFTVEDNGIGMSEEFCANMFEPYEQENRPEVSLLTGTGLGLSIVKKYVDMLGGSIQVESTLNAGTKITVSLPLEIAANGCMKQEECENCSVIDLEGRTALLCEDNDLNAEITRLLLNDAGVRLERAVNGSEGVKMFSESDAGYYDVVLMDLQMPVMGGCEASAAIRGLDRPDAGKVPVIALTADVFEESKRELVKCGMNDIITKPIDQKLLLETISRHLM
jgi:PAS domain S-box-containing protein